MRNGSKGIEIPFKSLYGHLPEIPFHNFLQKVWDPGKQGYQFRTPDLKKTKQEGTPKGKS